MMRGTWLALPFIAVLSGCGDPLAGIERVSELPEPLPETGAAAALPAPEELNRDTPILASLFRPAKPKADPAIEDAVRQAQEEAITPEATGATEAGLPQSAPSDAGRADTPQQAEATLSRPTATRTREGRRGLVGWLRQSATRQQDQVPAETVAEIAPDELDLVNAELAPQADGEVEVASRNAASDLPAQNRPGLFRRVRSNSTEPVVAVRRDGPDARDVSPGTRLAFGEIARVCDVRPRELGTIISKSSRNGRGYVLYDSAPNSPTARTFYVTGFADNCPRQFTAAVALFGAPELHEQLRYGLPARDFPYSETDEAYEQLKARICRVGRSKPCGARVSRLRDSTTFISAYEAFGETARWTDILVHEGEILASALKTP